MIRKIRLNYVSNLFTYNLRYNTQEIVPSKRKLQYLELLERLSIVLYNLNPAKFKGYITAEKWREAREYSNYAIIKKNLNKIEKPIN